MTITELYHTVSMIGFGGEDINNMDSLFLSAANHAYVALNSIRPRRGVKTVTHTQGTDTVISMTGAGGVTDFMSLPDFPVLHNRMALSRDGFSIDSRDTVVILAKNESGNYSVEYNRSPQKFTRDDIASGTAVQLDEDLCGIMHLLIIATMKLADEDTDMASYYMKQFNDSLSAVIYRQRNQEPGVYVNANGW